jgi:hypothetical protein
VVIVALLFTEDASPPGGSGLALSEAAGDPGSKKILGHLLFTLLRGTHHPFFIYLNKFYSTKLSE